jgi:hypothetical protein
VATADRELARRARAIGARVVPSDALRRALDRAGASSQGRRVAPEPMLDGPEGLLALAALVAPSRDGAAAPV